MRRRDPHATPVKTKPPKEIELFPSFLSHWGVLLALFTLGVGLVAVGLVWSFSSSYQGRIYPNVTINNIDVSGLSIAEANDILSSHTEIPQYTVTLNMEGITASSSSAELGLASNQARVVDAAYGVGRQGRWWQQAGEILGVLFSPRTFNTTLSYQPERATGLVAALNEKVATPYQEPAAVLATSGRAETLSIEPGQLGREVSAETAQQLILDSAQTSVMEIEAPVASVGAVLNPDQQTAALERAQRLVGKKASFKYEEFTFDLNDQKLVGLLTFPTGINNAAFTQIATEWSKRLDRAAQDAVFEYDPTTLEVKNFVPSRDGLALDRVQTRRQIGEVLAELENSTEATQFTTQNPKQVSLVVVAAPPTRSLANTNELGIRERIGFGDSEYDHSIPTRIHNVGLTAQKINNFIVKPGEEFSFNKALGDVSSATGFQPAYIIKDGQTVLGDGGGVCQVSTTLFRALLNGGLNITKRKAHSYRVSYYELNQQPGFDATVYSGEVDLRFVNDTPGHVLIHTENDSKNLYLKIELYGTSDGRVAEISDYRSYDARPALPTVLIPDPSLPPGSRKQIDFAVSGIKTSFKHTVRDKNGTVISEKTYNSNYVPWAAKYLVGP